MSELQLKAGETLPDDGAHAAPQRRVNGLFIGTMALSLLGVWMSLFAPIQVLLAQQMELIAPNGKEAALGLVMGLGSMVALLANPVIGALSDRTSSRFGRRHPWNLAGILLGAAALMTLGQQTSLAGVIFWWGVVQFATSAVLSALTAAVPDRVPVSQRATVSAWNGVTLSLGVVIGALLTTSVVTGIANGYLVVGVALILLSLPFVLATRDEPLPKARVPAWSFKAFIAGFWISPKRHPDFAWAWATRFLVGLSSATGTMFFLYFLRDALQYEQLFPGKRAEDGLLILVLIYTSAVVVSAFVSAMISDRTGKRRTIVTLAGIVMGSASLMLAFWQTWPAAMLSSAILGLGYGAYVAVDQALISQVLPSSTDHGKDLGMINIAIVGPQVLAPVICAIAVTQFGGYSTLYAFSGLVGLLGGVLVQKIRSVP